MSLSIGSLSVLTMHGRVTPTAPSLEEITRPGVDGHAYKDLGKRAPVSQVVTETDVKDAAGLATHLSSAMGLVGTFVTVEHPTGKTVANVCVLACELAGTKAIGTAVGGVNTGNIICTLRWTLQASADAPPPPEE
jgi:hypothetical protein